MNGQDGHSRKSVRVDIAGDEYMIRTEADEEYTRRCAALVDERLTAVREAMAGEGSVGGAHKRAGILAALSIADDLLKYKAQARARAQELVKRLEEALASDGAKSDAVPDSVPDAAPENDAPTED